MVNSVFALTCGHLRAHQSLRPWVALALLLLSSRHLPAMLMPLALGVVAAFAREPGLLAEIGHISLRFHLPASPLGQLTWSDLVLGTLIVGLANLSLHAR